VFVKNFIFSVIASIIVFGSIYYFLNSTAHFLVTFILNIITVLIFFIALAMFYKVFTNYLIKLGGNSQFAI
jgi:uncharacterized membrane protein YbhN (UPF0104 family)